MIVAISMIIECLSPQRTLFDDICPAMIPEKNARIMPMLNMSVLFDVRSKVMSKDEKLEMNATFI